MTLLDPQDVPRARTPRDPGARIQAPTIRDPRPNALQQFSRAISNVSTAFKNLHDRRTKVEDDASIDAFRLRYEPRVAEVQNEALNSALVGQEDFVDQQDSLLVPVQDEVFTSLEEEGYRLSPEGRARAEELARETRIRAARSGAVAAQNQRAVRLYDTAATSLDAIVRDAGGTGDIESAYERVEGLYGQVTDVLAPDKARAFRDAARVRVVQQAIAGHVERGEFDEARALVQRETGFASGEASQVARTIIDVADAQGVDPALLLAIGQMESGLNPDARAGLPTLAYPESEGLVTQGNINLNDRPRVESGGEIATLRSVSVEIDGQHVLIPTVTHDGEIVSTDEAVRIYRETGEHLGKFETEEQASAYSRQLSEDQGTRYGREPLSSARGLFQITDATALGLGLTRDAGPAAQARAAATNTRQNIDFLKSHLGDQPTPGEAYLAHVLGPQMAVSVLKADADTPISEILRARDIVANPQFEGMSAADITGWAARKMQEGLDAIAPMLEGRDIAPAGVPLSSIPSLSRGVSQAQREAVADLKVRLNEDVASIQATGVPLEIDPEQAEQLLTDREFEEWETERANARVFYDLTKDFDSLSEDEIRRRVASVDPDGGEGFAARQRLFSDVEAEAEETIDDRRAGRGAAIHDQIDDDIASIRTTGVPLEIDEGQAREQLGEDGFRVWQQLRADAQAFHDAIGDAAVTPSGELRAAAEELRPTPGEEGYLRQLQLYEEARDMANAAIEKRYEDPAASVEQHPRVQAARQADDSGSAEWWQGLVASRMAAQEAIGLPERFRLPLTHQEIDQWATSLERASEDRWPTEFARIAQSFDATYGPYADQAMNQFAERFVRTEGERRQAGRILRELASGTQAGLRREAAAFDEQSESDAIRAAAASFETRNRLITDPGIMFGGNMDAVRSTRGRGQLPTPDMEDIENLLSAPEALPEFIETFGVHHVPEQLQGRIPLDLTINE